VPAGKLDHAGEPPEQTAKRELAEEIGRGARSWRYLTRFYTSPGFTDEECHIYLAEDLYEEHADSGEDERIEIERTPLDRLDDTIRECQDSKTLVGLLWLRAGLG
jgi:8-oxo-dGTP pyrophosphatase MutT (NUDIX family)